jgi:hypothetical protein
MNNLRKSALKRWKRQLEYDTSKIPKDKESLLKKVALCGFLAGDGCVQVRKERKEDNYFRYQLDLFSDDKLMLNTYCSFIEEIYNKKPTISNRDNMFVARLSLKFIVLDLLKICNFGMYKWSFPNKLFKIKGSKEAWLRAFFSAEGYVGKRVIKIQSVNIKSIKIVLKMLSDFDIKGNYYEYSSKNKNHSKVGMIFINDKRCRLNYYNKIGFWHEKKNLALKKELDL